MINVLRLFSALYASAVSRRNRKYDAEKRPLVRVSVPVVSIGNLSTGGSGKTPVTALVVQLLQSMRRRPAVIARGYKRRGRGLTVVHDGVRIRTDWAQAGDEPFMLATMLGVPVVVCSNKADAAVHAAGTLACDVIVVDDGFQHRDLHRDLDIVLIDAATMRDRQCIPAGRLREPLASLHRADVVLLMDQSVEEADVRIFMNPEAVIARIVIERGQCTLLATGDDVPIPSRCIAVCGIAQPQRFTQMLRADGADVVSQSPFPDHHDYTQKDVEKLIELSRTFNASIATTAKDAVKLHAFVDRFVAHGIQVIVVPIHATLDVGVNDFLAILNDRTRR